MKRVQLFATCLGDMFFPTAVRDAESILVAAGIEVIFPKGQVCCGQPAFNSGHRGAARRVARTFRKAFVPGVPIVVPSGSCATMTSHYLPELLDVEPYDIWELSSYLDHVGIEIEPKNQGRTVVYHDSCHMLRDLGIYDAPRRLLERSGALLVSLERSDLCCGFGGTFSVRQPEISLSMADDKLDAARVVGAEAIITADPGCLMHLNGRAARREETPVVHLATALWRGVGATLG